MSEVPLYRCRANVAHILGSKAKDLDKDDHFTRREKKKRDVMDRKKERDVTDLAARSHPEGRGVQSR